MPNTQYKAKVYKPKPHETVPTHRNKWYWDIVPTTRLDAWRPGDPNNVAIVTGAASNYREALTAVQLARGTYGRTLHVPAGL